MAAGAILYRKVVVPDLDVGFGNTGVRCQNEKYGVGIGQKIEGELGLGADGIQARCIEDDQALTQQGMRKVDDCVAPTRDRDRTILSDTDRICDVGVVVEPVAPRQFDRHRLGLADLGKDFRHPVRRREIERQGDPLIRAILEFRDRGVADPGFDRQQAYGRWPGGIEQQFRRTHGGASRRRGQRPLAEVGKKSR